MYNIMSGLTRIKRGQRGRGQREGQRAEGRGRGRDATNSSVCK